LTLLVERHEEHPAFKKLRDEVLTWLSCLQQGANVSHMLQQMPLPPHHLFLVPAYSGCRGKEGVKWASVWYC